MIPSVALSKDLLNEGESIVVDTRTHPKALLFPLLMLVVLLAIGTFVQRQVDQKQRQLGRLGAGGHRHRLVRRAPAPDLADRDLHDHTRRLITRHGVITRKGHDIPLTRVSDVAYERDLIDRLLGCGTLVISDASTHGQVALPDIPRIEETQRKLNDLLHDLHQDDDRHEEGV